jgi:hypothetical protein
MPQIQIVKGEHAAFWPHVKWLREAELKHGRGAMIAFVGTLFAVSGITFPGELGGFFYEKVAHWDDGLASAVKTNPFGMAQLFISIGLIEVSSYMCENFLKQFFVTHACRNFINLT